MRKIDPEALNRAVTADLAVAREFLKAFYPAGWESGDFWVLGNLAGKNGASAQIHTASLCGKDQNPLDGGKVSGAISIIERVRSVRQPEAAEILKTWLEGQGIETSDEEEKSKSAAFPWTQRVQATTGADRLALAKFRGWPEDLVDRVFRLEALAKVNGAWCFPLRNKNDIIVGVDQLVEHPELGGERQKWEPKPKGCDRLKNWYGLGCPLVSAKNVFVAESRWDALSVLSLISDEELRTTCVLGATGAAQNKLTIPNTVETLYLVMQNDGPCETWALQIALQVGCQTDIKTVRPPDGTKDLNELLRNAGKLVRDLIENAKRYSVQGGRLAEEKRPKYYAHGGPIDALPAITDAIKVLKLCGQAFNYRGIPMWLRVNAEAQNLDINNFNSLFQQYAIVTQVRQGPQGVTYVRDKVFNDQINGILKSPGRSQLPEAKSVLEYSHLVRIGNELVIPQAGYIDNCVGGPFFIRKNRDPLPKIGFDEGLDFLLSLLKDFNWQTPADKSRYFGLMLSPELQTAGFLRGWYPIALIESPIEGCGKSSLMSMIPRLYRETPAIIAADSGKDGVGSFNNSISAGLLQGKWFLDIDNQRKKLDSTLIESALTEEWVMARSAFIKETPVRTRGLIWTISNNGTQFTPDFISRALPVTLRGLPENGWTLNSLDREAMLDREQPKAEASRHAIIRKWFADGTPLGQLTQHRFRDWSEIVCGVVERTCGQPEMLKDLQASVGSRTEPDQIWLKNVSLQIMRDDERRATADKMIGKVLLSRDLEDVCFEHRLHPPSNGSLSLKNSIGVAITRLSGGPKGELTKNAVSISDPDCTKLDLGHYIAHLGTTRKDGNTYRAVCFHEHS